MGFTRNETRRLQVGKVPIGGGSPVSIQSMTNSQTADVEGTLAQISRLAMAGCDIVRIAIPDQASAQVVDQIKEKSPLPLIADIHFDYRLALTCLERGIDGLRINPGNIGGAENVRTVAQAAKKRGVPIRIGVNAGSLEKEILAAHDGHPTAEGMVASALHHIKLLEDQDFEDIKVSLKAQNVPLTLAAYRLLAEQVNYPLHLGITESGTVTSGVIRSSVGIGALLAEGLGDTFRVSLTGPPEEEIAVAKEILKVLELREGGPTLVSCPTCGRCQIDLYSIAKQVEEKLKGIPDPIKVAVMGCVVNGPGEAREADIGIAGGKGAGILFRKGEVIRTVPEDQLVGELFTEIDKWLKGER
ncbi:MAG: flavodoxin-dependent (E)-4-hydroxy-3-methylbut-2-enyl-diphosphate synthase [Negativicutes bacterium]|jgi:(E)-4-hydroxy-3-methylbut-2-enyl-diphosphate synthase|nr:flavodoxin-dependent (E)-4-hydroxy-3-methylbut-2-enyl-diphosphate synthase [Negativicutes bacterium]